MAVILSVLDSFARGVCMCPPRQTAVLTFVHRYVIAFRCGATSGAIYCPMSPPLSLPSRPPGTCRIPSTESYSCLFTFSFYLVILKPPIASFSLSSREWMSRRSIVNERRPINNMLKGWNITDRTNIYEVDVTSYANPFLRWIGLSDEKEKKKTQFHVKSRLDT